MKHTRHLFLIALWACAACGDSGSASGSSVASESDVNAYRKLALSVDDAVQTYGHAMAQGSDTAACQQIHQQYQDQVGPMVDQLVQMGAAMDGLADAHRGANATDVSCVATSMMAELDHHDQVACTLDGTAADDAEAQRHINAMRAYDGQLTARCNEMMTGLETGSWSWGPMMQGCAGAGSGVCGGMMMHGMHCIGE